MLGIFGRSVKISISEGNANLDFIENEILYIGLSLAKSSFTIKAYPGYRFHFIPYTMIIDPPYHPATDKQFFIPPYATLDIFGDTHLQLYLDNKISLSKESQWKFIAIKQNYLLQELIKLGGMNHDSLSPILDLVQDIHLPEKIDESTKDFAGVPSTFTNLT